MSDILGTTRGFYFEFTDSMGTLKQRVGTDVIRRSLNSQYEVHRDKVVTKGTSKHE